MFRHLETEHLKALHARANASGGSNLEVMLGLALAFMRIELDREIAERARVDALQPREPRRRVSEPGQGPGLQAQSEGNAAGSTQGAAS